MSQPEQGGPIILVGGQVPVHCPSVLTNSGRYWPATIAILILLSIILSNVWQLVGGALNKPYLDGKIEFESNALIDESEVAADQTDQAPARIPVSIPRWKHLPAWFLDRHSDGTYSFQPRESVFSRLKFVVNGKDGGRQVEVCATQASTGEKTPLFQFMRTPIGVDGCPCDKEPIIVEQDIIHPDISALP